MSKVHGGFLVNGGTPQSLLIIHVNRIFQYKKKPSLLWILSVYGHLQRYIRLEIRYDILIGGDLNMCYFSIYWEVHTPN